MKLFRKKTNEEETYEPVGPSHAITLAGDKYGVEIVIHQKHRFISMGPPRKLVTDNKILYPYIPRQWELCG